MQVGVLERTDPSTIALGDFVMPLTFSRQAPDERPLVSRPRCELRPPRHACDALSHGRDVKRGLFTVFRRESPRVGFSAVNALTGTGREYASGAPAKSGLGDPS